MVTLLCEGAPATEAVGSAATAAVVFSAGVLARLAVTELLLSKLVGWRALLAALEGL